MFTPIQFEQHKVQFFFHKNLNIAQKLCTCTTVSKTLFLEHDLPILTHSLTTAVVLPKHSTNTSQSSQADHKGDQRHHQTHTTIVFASYSDLVSMLTLS